MQSTMQRTGMYKGLSVQITVKAVKRLNLRVMAQQPNVRISIPPTSTADHAFEFIDNNREWIDHAIVELKEWQQRSAEAEPPLSRKQAIEFAKLVHLKLQYWSKLMGVRYSNVAIRSMKTRWGSCSADGRICINRRLAHYPPGWLDYVVIHELAHRRHMNHSKEFWAVVEKYCPDWKEIRGVMRNHTKSSS